MIKKTVAAGIAALAVAGVLGGAAVTSTAQAGTPTTATAAGDVTAQYSKGFNMFNTLGVDLELSRLVGEHEGAPPEGSRMSYGQFQRFEVKHNSQLNATFKVIDPNHVYWGSFQITMIYDFFGGVSAYVVDDSTGMGIAITHPGDETWGITQ